jgi:hypothetical protein
MEMIDRIVELMQTHKDNKATLARNAGLPYTTVDGLFKRGCENAYISTAKKISEYYGVTLDYLILGNEGLSNDAALIAAKYDKLDQHGRELIDLVVDHEIRRVQSVALAKQDKAWAQSRADKEITDDANSVAVESESTGLAQ